MDHNKPIAKAKNEGLLFLLLFCMFWGYVAAGFLANRAAHQHCRENGHVGGGINRITMHPYCIDHFQSKKLSKNF